jgi:hypothetical protein
MRKAMNLAACTGSWKLKRSAALLLAAIVAVTAVHAQNKAQQKALAHLAANSGKARPMTSNTEGTNYSLSQPGGLAFDAAGDLFVADTDNNRILEVNLQGIITVIAGSGDQGFGGDGGPAVSALLDTPTGIALDASGNLYIADTNNQRIRVVTAGNISTIAGTGSVGYSGDGGPATAALLAHPSAVAVDSSGNIYIADTNNQCIRMISGGTISTVAGSGEQGFSGDGGLATAAMLSIPAGVAVDGSQNIYIADTGNQRIRMVTHSTGFIATIAGTGVAGYNGDGSAATVQLANPHSIALDSSGTVYFADSDNNVIRSLSGGTIQTVAGNTDQGDTGDTGVSTGASMDTPLAVATYNGALGVADTNNDTVRLVTASSIYTTAGQPTTGTESLTLTGTSSITYGTGAVQAAFSNGSSSATGSVKFLDSAQTLQLGTSSSTSPVLLAAVPFTSNLAQYGTTALAAGTHSLVASYPGDSANAAIISGVFVLSIAQAPASASANAATMEYGQSIPTLSGTLNGILPQDIGKVSAQYSTQASSTSAPGAYPIQIALTGQQAGNYALTVASGSGSLLISKAGSSLSLKESASTPIFETTETLTATVLSSTTGNPTGTVSFYDGSTLLNPTGATVNSSGIATLTLDTLAVGAHNISAVYNGDTNFLTSSSSNTVSTTVLSPDFAATTSSASLQLLPAQSVSYVYTVTPVNPTFVYPVTFAASGLPAGVSASFSPSTIQTGSAASTTTVTFTASAQASNAHPRLKTRPLSALALLLLPLFLGYRLRHAAQRSLRLFAFLLMLLPLAAAFTSCGGSGFFNHPERSYTVTVTATCGPVTHSADVTLTVQ